MPTTLLNVAAKSATGNETARSWIDQAPRIPTNVSDAERVASLALGGLAFGVGLGSKSTLVNILGAVTGGALFYRGLTGHCMGFQLLGTGTAPGSTPGGVMAAGEGVKVEHTVTINKPPHDIYVFWRKYSNLARFMNNVVSVTETDRGRSHWVAKGPLGSQVEWDAETIVDRPGEAISWKSTDDADVDTTGSVHFRPAAGGLGTDVVVSLKYLPPAGKVGAAVARLFGKAPEQEIKADLARLKSLLEGGQG